MNYDVIIVGGGIVGLTTALLLPKFLRIAIIEEKSLNENFPTETDFDYRVSAVNLASQAIFNTIQIWPQLENRRVSLFRGLEVWEKEHHQKIEFPSIGHIIEHRVMMKALLDQARLSDHIEWIMPASPLTIIQADNQIQLSLKDRPAITAKLVIAADGGDSWVRQYLAIPTDYQSYFQKALVATVTTTEPHLQTAYQVFADQTILALLPLSDPHTCSIVWSAPTDFIQKLQQLNSELFNQTINTYFGKRLGEIKIMSPCYSFQLRKIHAQKYVLPHIALIGDAAHVIHPLAGQGLNLGLQDALALSEVVMAAARKNRNIGALDTLRRYERARRPNNLIMQNTMDVLKAGFGAQSQLVKNSRNKGIEILNRSSILKGFIANYAAGNYSR